MNRKMVFYMLGRIMQLEAVLMLPAMLCSLAYSEKGIMGCFLITALGCAAAGSLFTVMGKTKNKSIYAKEGFVIVALAWIVMSAVGCVPFVLSGEIPNFIDAFFETVSGFTTTGSSILRDVEAMSYGLLFWRSFTHWVGGMGVLVLIMAILPLETGRTIHIMRAEMPGPIVGKLVPKAKSTAKILYLIYIALTVIEAVFLLCGGMPLFDSLVLTFGTAGTGGFGIKADSIGGYSPYCQWVITVFMLIFGVNFNLYYLILVKRIKTALKSEELWCYIGIVCAVSALIGLNVYGQIEQMATLSDTVRHSVFQVAAIITTTGYSTVNFDLWPGFSKMLVFILMFVGGCAGSTAGGIKLSRVMLLFKHSRANLKHVLHSRSTESVRLEGKPVDRATVSGVTSYLTIYVLCIVVTMFLISFDNFGLETNISAAVTCFNNVGPGFDTVGPALSFADYSGFSKLVLSLAMLLGRLEIYPMLLLFTPAVWIKSKKVQK